MYCVGGSLKNLCHFEMGGGGVWQMLTSSGGGGRSMLTVADRGEGGGIKFAKILLTSYVNAPLFTEHTLPHLLLATSNIHYSRPRQFIKYHLRFSKKFTAIFSHNRQNFPQLIAQFCANLQKYRN